MSVSVSVSADAASEASREWLLFHTQVLFVQGCRARVARLCGPGAKVGWRLERRSSGAGASQEGRGRGRGRGWTVGSAHTNTGARKQLRGIASGYTHPSSRQHSLVEKQC